MLIPVQTQYFALRGLDLLFNTIEKVKARINPALLIRGILPTMADSRTIHSREVLEELRNTYGQQVCKTAIPQTIKIRGCASGGAGPFSVCPVVAGRGSVSPVGERNWRRHEPETQFP